MHSMGQRLHWLAFVLAALAVTSAAADYNKREFDYFALVRQWDPSYCDFSPCGRGRYPKRTDFTLHGLWPDYSDGSWPQFCTWDRFDESLVSDLLPALRYEWPSFAAKGGASFWQHEYEKHGTCCKAVFPTEHDYFYGVLQLNDDYNLLGALAQQGITPSESENYAAEDMEAAFDAMTGVQGSSIVECKGGQVTEVQLCLDKSKQPIKCPHRGGGRCGDLLLKPLDSSSMEALAGAGEELPHDLGVLSL